MIGFLCTFYALYDHYIDQNEWNFMELQVLNMLEVVEGWQGANHWWHSEQQHKRVRPVFGYYHASLIWPFKQSKLKSRSCSLLDFIIYLFIYLLLIFTMYLYVFLIYFLLFIVWIIYIFIYLFIYYFYIMFYYYYYFLCMYVFLFLFVCLFVCLSTRAFTKRMPFFMMKCPSPSFLPHPY